jgi:hypothetical protein
VPHMSFQTWKPSCPDDEIVEELPPEDEEADTPMVLTVYDPPAIPLRNYDWTAYREGQEEAGPYGYGVTRQEAIADLLSLEEDGF